jgi:3',5'-cyclic AMP phosphodiesterase CpdA
MPVYLMPGNHDDRGQMRRSFPEHHYLGAEGFVQYSVQVGGMRLIPLDTVDHGQSHGVLCQRRLDWLAGELDAHKHQPVVVAMHHPPFKTMIGHMDKIGLLEGAGELETLIGGYFNVERVICGHLHRAIDVRFGGTIACTTPAPAHQVALDLQPEAESCWVLEPPAFRICALEPSGRMTSHVAASGELEGPYPFHEDGVLIE